MGGSHALFFFFPSKGTIFLLAAGTGLAYGGFFATTPTIVSLFFGVLHFGANYGLVLISPGLLFVSKNFVDLKCFFFFCNEAIGAFAGNSCTQTSFFISSVLCVLSAALSFFLVYRRKRLHSK